MSHDDAFSVSQLSIAKGRVPPAAPAHAKIATGGLLVHG
eukprot:gene6696-2391_t